MNDNITLTERETDPIVGIRNVKTHYNAFKNDIMFTFYDDLNCLEEKAWNVCYNEVLQHFETFYSWIPSYSANIDNMFFTFDRNVSKWLACIEDYNHDLEVVEGSHIVGKDYKVKIRYTKCDDYEIKIDQRKRKPRWYSIKKEDDVYVLTYSGDAEVENIPLIITEYGKIGEQRVKQKVINTSFTVVSKDYYEKL